MGRAVPPQLVSDFLGSAQVLATAVTEVVEERLLREIAGEALTLSQFKLLKLVANTDAHSVGDVAAFLGVSNAAASKAVDKLVRRKQLVRAEGRLDRRAAVLSLTARSRRLLAAYDAARDQKLTEIFRAFSPEELEHTTEILDRLSAGLLDHDAKPEETCLQCGIYFREKCLLRKLVGRQCFYANHRSRGEPEAESNGENGAEPPQ
ncbi:MAG: MarR family winged helix-turn-helix transcriptional regulator [Acidobacteria bacterium]|nr:MarR family winged helix-turn-helix transcriptional regulator [Acidobacteriota bacterium]